MLCKWPKQIFTNYTYQSWYENGAVPHFFISFISSDGYNRKDLTSHTALVQVCWIQDLTNTVYLFFCVHRLVLLFSCPDLHKWLHVLHMYPEILLQQLANLFDQLLINIHICSRLNTSHYLSCLTPGSSWEGSQSISGLTQTQTAISYPYLIAMADFSP